MSIKPKHEDDGVVLVKHTKEFKEKKKEQKGGKKSKSKNKKAMKTQERTKGKSAPAAVVGSKKPSKPRPSTKPSKPKRKNMNAEKKEKPKTRVTVRPSPQLAAAAAARLDPENKSLPLSSDEPKRRKSVEGPKRARAPAIPAEQKIKKKSASDPSKIPVVMPVSSPGHTPRRKSKIGKVPKSGPVAAKKSDPSAKQKFVYSGLTTSDGSGHGGAPMPDSAPGPAPSGYTEPPLVLEVIDDRKDDKKTADKPVSSDQKKLEKHEKKKKESKEPKGDKLERMKIQEKMKAEARIPLAQEWTAAQPAPLKETILTAEKIDSDPKKPSKPSQPVKETILTAEKIKSDSKKLKRSADKENDQNNKKTKSDEKEKPEAKVPLVVMPPQEQKPIVKASVDIPVNMDEVLRLGSVMERHQMSSDRKASFDWLSTSRSAPSSPAFFAAVLQQAVGDVEMDKDLALDTLNELMYHRTVSPDEYLQLSETVKNHKGTVTIATLAFMLKNGAEYYRITAN